MCFVWAFAWRSSWNLFAWCKNVFVIVCLSDWAQRFGWCVSWSWTDVALNAVLQPEITICVIERLMLLCVLLWICFHKSFPAKPETRWGMFSCGCSGCCAFVHFGVKKQFDPCYSSLFRVGVIYCALAIHFPWNADRVQAAFQQYSSELWLTRASILYTQQNCYSFL